MPELWRLSISGPGNLRLLPQQFSLFLLPFDHEMTIDFGTPFPAPTSILPSVKAIPNRSTEQLIQSLQYLRRVYLPDVRGTRRIKTASKFNGSHSLKPELPLSRTSVDEELESLRADAFERSYATRWLTSLIDVLISASEASEEEQECSTDLNLTLSTLSDSQIVDYEPVIQLAASILAVCAGTAAAGVFTRSYTFGDSMSISLQDAPLENGDYGTVGAQTWGSACVMSEMFVEMPEEFGLGLDGHERPTAPEGHLDGRPRRMRVLELGAGTGLVSLTVGKFLEGKAEELGYDEVEVVASDFHLSILSNLRTNVLANFPPTSSPSLISPSTLPLSTVSLSVHRLDWSEVASTMNALSPPFDEPFDLILGADIIYELEHALWIKSCLEKFLRRPSSSSTDTFIDHNHSGARFHLMIPLRRTHTLESDTIEQVFPRAEHTDSGLRLCITKKEVVLCEEQALERRGWRDGAGEVEYAYYVIEWAG